MGTSGGLTSRGGEVCWLLVLCNGTEDDCLCVLKDCLEDDVALDAAETLRAAVDANAEAPIRVDNPFVPPMLAERDSLADLDDGEVTEGDKALSVRDLACALVSGEMSEGGGTGAGTVIEMKVSTSRDWMIFSNVRWEWSKCKGVAGWIDGYPGTGRRGESIMPDKIGRA